ncbi:hypothetical protein LJC74_10120 [Eubacteriales bacterium OttesenSCG-928-A19]|nr:hypothetical protein [Eubacteriales bacterium OttesenSCG-928-A19]
MKKSLAVILVLTVLLTVISSVATMTPNAKTVSYYDENGNPIEINGMYYNNESYPMYNASSYYLDVYDDPAYVGGYRVDYYNQKGDLVAGNYYYDDFGNPVDPPATTPTPNYRGNDYRSGWCCGWCR